MNVSGKRILITGASGGIGSALATVLAQAGAHLILCGRQRELLENLRTQLVHSEQHICCCFDIAATDKGFILETLQSCGMIDILINNAGTSEFGWLEDQSVESIENQINTNLTAPIMLARMILPSIKKPGMIVNIGSCLGAIGYPGYSVYSATKFGLRGFSESLNRELKSEGIKVIYVAPRTTDTGFNNNAVVEMNAALGNNSDTPAVVARIVLSSIEKEKSNTTIGWPEKLFVIINAVFPPLVTKSIIKNIELIKEYAKKVKG